MEVNTHRHNKGLRTVALFEALKGAVVLLAGFGLLTMLGKNSGVLAAELVGRTHLNPAHHYPSIFIQAMSHLDNVHLWLLAGLAGIYCTVRFIEAYGLWHELRWAEWIAALSGAIYLPLEVYGLSRHVSWFSISTLVINLIIVGYMVALLLESRTQKKRPDSRIPG